MRTGDVALVTDNRAAGDGRGREAEDRTATRPVKIEAKDTWPWHANAKTLLLTVERYHRAGDRK